MDYKMKRLKKGVLIVFEGIDGSGKTTQAEILLAKLLKMGVATVYFREPSLGRWGREIKEKAAEKVVLCRLSRNHRRPE